MTFVLQTVLCQGGGWSGEQKKEKEAGILKEVVGNFLATLQIEILKSWSQCPPVKKSKGQTAYMIHIKKKNPVLSI